MVRDDIKVGIILVLFSLWSFLILFIIYKNWKRSMKYSGGYYMNAGQDIILFCCMTPKQILQILNVKKESDVIEHDIYIENQQYYMEVKRVKKLFGMNGPSVKFYMQFVSVEGGTYIVLSICNKLQILYSGRPELGLYEFFVKKLGCVPRNKIEKHKSIRLS